MLQSDFENLPDDTIINAFLRSFDHRPQLIEDVKAALEKGGLGERKEKLLREFLKRSETRATPYGLDEKTAEFFRQRAKCQEPIVVRPHPSTKHAGNRYEGTL